MADVDITSLSVEISAESQGAELNIDKLATAISNLRTKGNVAKVIDGLDKLTNSLTALKSAQGDFSGLEKVTQFIEGIGKVNASESAKSINTLAKSIQKIPDALSGMSDFSDALDSLRDITDSFNSLSTIQAPKGLSSTINALKKIPDTMSGMDSVNSDLTQTKAVLASFNTLPAVAVPDGLTKMVNTLRRIPTVIAETNKADYASLADNIRNVMNALAPLSLLDVSGLKGLSSAFTALNKVPDLTDKLKATDLDSFASSCQKISTALTPLASQLDKVGNAFAKLPPQLSKVVTQANRVTAANEKQKKSYLSLSNQVNGFMRNMAKLVSLKAISEYLGKAVASFNDYYEATNLFGVSMKGLTGEADTFIQKMQTLLGIDPTEAMNNMATIQGLTTSFGLTSDKAYVLSKNLTQLGYDLSSLKNIPVKETFTKLQAAISGELEPIRRLGVDISNARLQQELYALGITTSISKLSQADKAILRYIAIMKQTGDAQGDLARTLDSPANQVRILQAQLSELARAVGSVLYPALKSILPPLIAAVELVKEFVQWIAKLMGVKTVDFPDMSKTSASVEDTSDALDNAAASAGKAKKALKDYTMGFDELNIIDPTKGSSSSSSGSGASAGNILGDIDLSGYDMFKDYVGTAVDEIKAKLEKLAPLIAGIAAGFATWAIGNALLEALDKIKGDGSLIEGILKLWKSPIMGAAIAAAIMAARFVDLYQNSEDFRKGLQRIKDLIYLAGLGFQQGWNKSLTDGKLGESIKELKDSLSGLKEAFLNLLPEEVRDKIKQLDLDLGDLAVTLAGIGLMISGHPVAGLAVLGFEAITVAVRGLGSESEAEAFQMKSDWHNAFVNFGTEAANAVSEVISSIAEIVTKTTEYIGLIQNGQYEFAELDATANGGFISGFALGLAGLITDFTKFVGWLTNGVTESDRLDTMMNGTFLANFLLGIADVIIDISKFVGWLQNGVTDADRLDTAANGTFIANFLLGIAQIIQDFQIFIGWVQNGVSESDRLDTEMNGGFIANFVMGIAQIIHDVDVFVGWITKGVDESDRLAIAANGNFAEKFVLLIADVVNGIKDAVEWFQKLTDKISKFNPIDVGKNIIDGIANGIKGNKNVSNDAAKELTDGVKKTAQDELDIHSPSKWFEQIGVYIDQGLANGITAAQGYVDTAMQGLIGEVTNMGNQFIEQGKQIGLNFVTNLDQTLTSTWERLDTNLQNDFFGTIQNLWQAAQSGDVKTIGTTIAAVMWHAMGEEQRTQIKTIATNMITNLSTQLTNALSTLSGQAYQIGGGLLNGITSKFGEILQKTKQLGGSLSSTFQAVKGPLKSVATAISTALSGGLASAFPTIYASMGTLISTIGASFVAMLHAIGAALSATIFGIPAGLVALGAAAVLAVSIASIVGGLGGKKSSSGSSYGSTGYNESDLSQIDYSNVPGTPQYDSSNGGVSSSYASSATQQLSASEIREAVYNGAYNALLDYKQRYGNEDKNNVFKFYLDGKQITASVEKTQSDRGRTIMGNEAYSY